MPFQNLKEAYESNIKGYKTNAYVSNIFKETNDVCFCLDKPYKQICYPGYKCGNCIPTDKCKECDRTTSC